MPLPQTEIAARILLQSLPEIGVKRYQGLLQHFTSAHAALIADAEEWRQLRLPAKSIAARKHPDYLQLTDRTLAWLAQPNHHVFFSDQADYPFLLKNTAGAPNLLFAMGDHSIIEQPQLAIVGSRNASVSSKQTAFQFSKALSSTGFVVTSGLAQGIDAAAHEGAVAVGKPTIAVVGTGLNLVYPARHRPLQEAILQHGGLVLSELPLDSQPLAAHFPRRNRIISGLALGVLVIEANPNSGSLITARLAAEQGREVYAIPGSIHYPGARGCHQLIREGATLVETVEHILEELQSWKSLPESSEAALDNHSELPVQQQQLLQLIQAERYQTEELAALSQLSIPELLPLLTDLEIFGLISNENGLWLYHSGKNSLI